MRVKSLGKARLWAFIIAVSSRRNHPIDIKLIAIDMDGTLLGEDGQVSERNLTAMREAEAAGIEIVIATGRRHCYAMHILRHLHLHPESALLSSNGTVIRTIGARLLYRTSMPLETARNLCAHMKDFRETLVLTFDNVGHNGEDSRGALTVEDFATLEATLDRWVTVNEPYIAEVKPLEDALQGEPPIQMMLCGTVAKMRAAERRLLQYPHVTGVGSTPKPDTQVTLHCTVYTDRDLCILDILPAGCSKATGLEELVRLRGITMNQVMAIGDNWNDVPMLEAAGRAVLMANAPGDVRALGHQRRWTMGLSNAEDGVAVAVQGLLAELGYSATERAAMVV